ncbi:DUF4199 domain-containing protein [Rapidithrix thailandica]|uniref:DUF4199 domain-containing protein n=1 Tax=Rapidithrix thailandica TaxID=413964 RepID=A0AAW9S3G3_9BACT
MEDKLSVKPVAIKYGLILAVASFAYSFVLNVTNKTDDQLFATINYLIFILVFVFAFREFRTSNEGFMKYSEGLKLGTLTGLIAGFGSGLLTYLYMIFIDDSVIQVILNALRDQYARNPQFTEEMVEQVMAMMTKFITPLTLFIAGTLGNVFFGFLISLIIAAIMKKEKPEYEV